MRNISRKLSQEISQIGESEKSTYDLARDGKT